MIKPESYLTPLTEVFTILAEQSFVFTYNETNQTETIGRDVEEEDL